MNWVWVFLSLILRKLCGPSFTEFHFTHNMEHHFPIYAWHSTRQQSQGSDLMKQYLLLEETQRWPGTDVKTF